MKIYLYYLKSEKNKLYAFTDNKEYSKLFSSTRNMKLFNYKTIDVDEDELFILKDKYWENELEEYFLDDDENSYHIICTNNEEIILNDSCEQLGDNMVFFKSYFDSFKFLDKKVVKLIDNLTDISAKNSKIYGEGTGKYDLEMQINTFSLFYYLFKNTF